MSEENDKLIDEGKEKIIETVVEAESADELHISIDKVPEVKEALDSKDKAISEKDCELAELKEKLKETEEKLSVLELEKHDELAAKVLSKEKEVYGEVEEKRSEELANHSDSELDIILSTLDRVPKPTPEVGSETDTNTDFKDKEDEKEGDKTRFSELSAEDQYSKAGESLSEVFRLVREDIESGE